MKDQRKCALVTGASSGIGEAIAGRLVIDGFRVFGVALGSMEPRQQPRIQAR